MKNNTEGNFLTENKEFLQIWIVFLNRRNDIILNSLNYKLSNRFILNFYIQLFIYQLIKH